MIVMLWLVLVGASSLWIAFRGSVPSDLSAFLPRAATPAQRVLIEQLKSGLQTRLILIGLHGDNSKSLADASRELRDSLPRSHLFLAVYNGMHARNLNELTWRQLAPTLLFRYRFLLDPAIRRGHFTVKHLRSMLQGALAKLASPADIFTRALLPADPGGAYARLATKLAPAKAPRYMHGVWFSEDGKTALMVAETAAPGFGLARLSQAITELRGAFAALPVAGDAKLWLTGPAVFAVSARERIAREATALSVIASLILLVFLVVVLRSLRAVVLGIIPLATGVLVGVAVVVGVFGAVHGITLAFGITLLGVAIDYPLHFFVHRELQVTPEQTIRSIRPTLVLGVSTTAIGYLAMLFSGVEGLAELALFAIIGLATAAATVCWVLPPLAQDWQWSAGWRLPKLRSSVRIWRGPWLVYGTAGVAAVYLIATPGQIWQNDPAALSPLPVRQLHLDRVLRHEFHAPDVSRLIAVTAVGREGALEKLERLRPYLERLKNDGALADYYLLTEVFPSRVVQRKRRTAIPPAAEMRERLARASANLPFKKDVFTPYLADLERSRTLPVLGRARLRDNALALRVDAELRHVGKRWQAIVPLRHVENPPQVEMVLASSGVRDAYYIDIKRLSGEMLTHYRANAIHLFLIGSAFTVILLLVSLKSLLHTVRVLVPAYSAAVVTAAILVASGVALTLFHLVSLLLVIGLGLDYALFFNRSAATPDERRRTVWGIVICSVSTVLVFGLLALAVTPVLQAIGVTVALGSVLSLLFAGLLVPAASGPSSQA